MGTIFDPAILHQCALTGLDKPLDEAFDSITAALAERYPGHIHEGPRDWMVNNAGGAMGTMTLLHASLSEYLILFGSPIGTAGHSGRYLSEVFDWVIQGEMWCYEDGGTEKTIYRPGDGAYLGANRIKGYRLPDACWMLEYSRGPIPTMLPFGLADTLLSTLDYRTLLKTLRNYGVLTVRSLLRGKF
jgi:hypothetical protein